MNDYSENVYDAEYIAKRKREMIPDGGFVRVPLTLMDSAPGGKSAAVLARDEAHRLMCDRMTRPKDFNPITGKRLVNDELDVSSLTEAEVFALAQRLAGPLQVAPPPDNYLVGSTDHILSRSRPAVEAPPPPHGDNRRPHAKQARDRAAGIQARDAAWAGMVARMTKGRR